MFLELYKLSFFLIYYICTFFSKSMHPFPNLLLKSKEIRIKTSAQYYVCVRKSFSMLLYVVWDHARNQKNHCYLNLTCGPTHCFHSSSHLPFAPKPLFREGIKESDLSSLLHLYVWSFVFCWSGRLLRCLGRAR